MPGRKTKPVELKIVTGNPGKRPLPEVGSIEIGPADKPSFLEGRAGALWDEYAPALVTIGTLDKASECVFAKWCVLQARFDKRDGDVPASLTAQIRALESMMGLDPSVRAKFAGSRKRQGDSTDKFFTIS